MPASRMNKWSLNRRQVLRAGGVSLAVPILESLGAAADEPRPRFVCMANPFGMLAADFFPDAAGLDAALPQNSWSDPHLSVWREVG